MKKRNIILNKIRNLRANYIDIYIDNSYALSERMQTLLDRNKMDQKDLAKKLNKEESEISKWMSGSHNFTLKTLAKIEEALDGKLLDVVDDESSKNDEVILFNYLDHHAFIFEPKEIAINSKQAYSPNFKNKKTPFARC